MTIGIHPADEAQIETQFVNRFAVRMGETHARIALGEQVMNETREIWTRALMMGREESLALANAILEADAKQRKLKEFTQPHSEPGPDKVAEPLKF